MKYLKLFVTLIIVLSVVATFAYAGRGTASIIKSGEVVNVTVPQIDKTTLSKSSLRQPSPIEIDQADVAKYQKSGSSMSRSIQSADMQKGTPVPQKKEVTDVTPLSGTYTIPGDFPSISWAVAVLNTVGISGNVVFELANTSYTEPCPITFGAYVGNGDYLVTIRPAAGVATTVNFVASSGEGKGFAFVGASNVTIDGLNAGSSLALKYSPVSVFPSSDPFGATIFITGASLGISVLHASVEGIVNNAVWANQTDGRPAIFSWTPNTDPYENDYIMFDGLTVTNATYAFKFLVELFPDGKIHNISSYDLTIKNCRVGGAYGNPVVHGGFLEYCALVDFSNNIFDGVSNLATYWNDGPGEYDISGGFSTLTSPYSVLYNSQTSASYFVGVDAGVFHDNIWRNVTYVGAAGDGMLVYGVRVSQGNSGLNIPAVFYNNRIYGVTNPCAGTTLCLRGTVGYVYHSSFQLTGASPGVRTASCINGVTYAYNNAISNEITGGTASSTNAITLGGTYDNNAVFSTGYPVSTYSTAGKAVAAGVNPHGVFGAVNFTSDLHLNPAGPSSAENIGRAHLAYVLDVDGDSRDTSSVGTPDAGVDEVSAALTTAFGPDVMCTGFLLPPSGVPTGVPQFMKVRVKNNAGIAVGSFDLHVTSSDGYDQTVTIPGLAALGLADTALTVPWTPLTPGAKTLNATVSVAGDIDATNDACAAYTVTASSPTPLLAGQTFTWNSGDESWARSIDFVRTSNFSKLSGPKDGAAMVTIRGGGRASGTPNAADSATYTPGAYASTYGYATTYPGVNALTSPWYDISGIGAGTDLFISLFQSMRTEAGWDRSWMEYTTDGLTWHHIGVLNDANGINWYNEALYANAQVDPDNFDYATAQQYGLMTGEPSDWPSWSSNGDPADGTPVGGPDGWVYSQIKLTAADYPTRATAIKFRFIAFSDAATAFDGWAIDNLYIGPSAAPLSGTITGKVFHDLDGDALFNNADTAFAGVSIEVYRFGNLLTTLTTDASGDYSFTGVDLPAAYTLKVIQTGYAYTTPADAATTGQSIVNHAADGSTSTVNFGAYLGSVAGVVFSDVNDNATKDAGEPGLEGWTVEVYKNSASGTKMGSLVTPAGGAYSFNLPPYATYFVKVVADANKGRQTLPASNGGYTFAISGNSGGAPVAAGDFGIFLFGTLKLYATMDVNGDGVKSPTADVNAPTGILLTFYVYKNGTAIDTVILGSGVAQETYAKLDVGTYTFTLISAIPAPWILTNTLTTKDITISTSGVDDSYTFLFFKQPKIYGYKFDDTNGNGTWDAGEPPLSGWTMNISGTGGGSVVTDVNGYYELLVGGGSHTVSEVLQSGWVQTKPTAPGTYTTTANTGILSPNIAPANFGNFKTYSVSGEVFRDYNNDGIKNGADAGMSGVTVTLTGETDQVSASNGSFTFAAVGTGSKTLAFTLPAGFACTVPVGGSYAITGASGVDVSAQDFGFFQTSDGTAKYRSFTLAQLNDVALSKTVKKDPKHPAFPNLITMLDEIYAKAKATSTNTNIMVGKAGQLLSDGKTVKGYIQPKKSADIQATLVVKGKTSNTYQTGAAHGLDFLYPGKSRVLKLNANLKPTVHNNVLVGDLLALGVSLIASDWEYTPAGFGDLLYAGAGDYQGMSVRDIYAAANNLMTNWEGEPTATYTALQTVIEAINAEMAGTLDTAQWFNGTQLKWTGVKVVAGSSVLLPGTSAAPAVYAHMEYAPEPTTFSIAQNYPNPFNPSTSIPFTVPTDANVTVKVYNVLGQEIATLLNNESYIAGTYEVNFDASTLTSGIYFYRVSATLTNEDGSVNTMVQTRKMMFAK